MSHLRPHIKPQLLGHWDTTPGLNFLYAHQNRVIRARRLDLNYFASPEHGGPTLMANVYLESTYSEVYSGLAKKSGHRNSPRTSIR